MEFLNIKILNINIKIWILIIISILFLLNFKKEKYSEKKNVIYNFNTTWCKYSRDFQPIWEEFEKDKNNDIEKLDVKCDDDNELCNIYPISGFPTVLLDVNGKIKIFNGARSVEELNKFVKENL